MTLLTALSAFDARLDRQKPRWREIICAQIACIIASLLIVAHELVTTGELPANIVERLLTLSAMVLTAAFFTGLVVEWSERRGRGYR